MTEPTREDRLRIAALSIIEVCAKDGASTDINFDDLAEIARAWLALHDAPHGIVDYKVQHSDLSGFVQVCNTETPAVDLGDSVRLVRWPVEVGRG